VKKREKIQLYQFAAYYNYQQFVHFALKGKQ